MIPTSNPDLTHGRHCVVSPFVVTLSVVSLHLFFVVSFLLGAGGGERWYAQGHSKDGSRPTSTMVVQGMGLCIIILKYSMHAVDGSRHMP
jgi:hypothetical protein